MRSRIHARALVSRLVRTMTVLGSSVAFAETEARILRAAPEDRIAGPPDRSVQRQLDARVPGGKCSLQPGAAID